MMRVALYKDMVKILQADLLQIAELYEIKKITVKQADHETKQVLAYMYKFEDELALLEGDTNGIEKGNEDIHGEEASGYQGSQDTTGAQG